MLIKILFLKEDICTTKIIEKWKPYKIIHLASMAELDIAFKIHYYFDVNVGGFINILEQAVKNNVCGIVLLVVQVFMD